MARALLVLHNDTIRDRALDWIRRAPKDTRVVFNGPKRTLPQNSRLWAMLTDVAQQVEWHGLKLSSEDWKLIFMDGLKHELRLVPNIDGNGFVNLGRSSSKLSKEEMTDLIELVFAFGAKHGVKFMDDAS